jgi:predicted DNA-binding transcriptional regulator AlpA
MGTKAKTPSKRKGARGETDFITKSQLAHAMGEVDPATIDEWVAAGTFPPPHSRPGERTTVWRRSYYTFYLENGYWPPESFRKPGSPS